VQQHYFQHNIIEAGAHWADSPWRTANNVNSTAFPEPPPYAGDKRIFMAEYFYDTAHPARRALHEAYIRKCLSSFVDNGSVLHLISDEFTGPLHFVQFWIDVIARWEKETGRHALVGLSATKDVQDAILSDPARAAVVDVIDIRYWWYGSDGELYAPQGGQSLAPRQHARLLKPAPTSWEQVYRAVREYRDKYPDKAVIVSEQGNRYAWAELLAGGSLPPIPVRDPAFLAAVVAMQPLSGAATPTIAAAGKGYVAYTADGMATIDLTADKGRYRAAWFDAKSGSLLTAKGGEAVETGKAITLHSPKDGEAVLWLRRQ
jgi:hypothetical protein